MVVLNALRDILSTPAILVGLLALRSPLPDVVSGTLKTIIGFLVLGGGATILIGALDPLGKMIEDGLGLQGVVPTNEAVVGLALEDFGARTAGIMGLAFVVNLVLARLSPLSYVFLTGHHVLFMSALAAVVLDSAGIGGVSLLLIGALIVGSLMVIMPALAMPFVRRIIDGEDIAVGHFGTLGYITSALVGRAVGNPEKSTEDVRVPRSLSFFRDNLVSTAVAMLVVYLLFTALAGPFFVGGGAGVFGNATGGRRGAVLGAFANGLIITLLPALLLAYLGQLGLANTTFGDSDFAWVGILLGSVVNLGVVFAWALAVLFVALAFALGYLFPVLRPRQESPEEDAVGEEAAGRPRTT